MDLDDSIACCKMIVKRIDTWLSELQVPDGQLDVSARFKVILGNKDLEILQKSLAHQVDAVNLLLTACNWYGNRNRNIRGWQLIVLTVNQYQSKGHSWRGETHERLLKEQSATPSRSSSTEMRGRSSVTTLTICPNSPLCLALMVRFYRPNHIFERRGLLRGPRYCDSARMPIGKGAWKSRAYSRRTAGDRGGSSACYF